MDRWFRNWKAISSSDKGLARKYVRWLVIFRYSWMAMTALLLLLARMVADMPVLILPNVGVLTLLMGATLYEQRLLLRPLAVSEELLSAHLVMEIMALSAILILNGGYTNPFTSLYLPPLAFAAAILSFRTTVMLALMAVLGYTTLMFVYLPLPSFFSHQAMMNLHLWGMWISFLVATLLIVIVLSNMAHQLRQGEAILMTMREKHMRDERIIALGTLAAGAAHTLSTPLATMMVVVDEMEVRHEEGLNLCDDLHILRQQVDRCHEALEHILATAGSERVQAGQYMEAEAFFEQIAQRWRAMRGYASLRCHTVGSSPSPCLLADESLAHALFSILDNAADASPQYVDFRLDWDGDELRFDIEDKGSGFPGRAMELAGETVFTSKSQGHGLGLLLARSVVERYGGHMSIHIIAHGGTRVSIMLPLKINNPLANPGLDQGAIS